MRQASSLPAEPDDQLSAARRTRAPSAAGRARGAPLTEPAPLHRGPCGWRRPGRSDAPAPRPGSRLRARPTRGRQRRPRGRGARTAAGPHVGGGSALGGRACVGGHVGVRVVATPALRICWPACGRSRCRAALTCAPCGRFGSGRLLLFRYRENGWEPYGSQTLPLRRWCCKGNGRPAVVDGSSCAREAGVGGWPQLRAEGWRWRMSAPARGRKVPCAAFPERGVYVVVGALVQVARLFYAAPFDSFGSSSARTSCHDILQPPSHTRAERVSARSRSAWN